ncbi:MAG: hypothetical protein R2911_19035 [Caldilineaceae bacterium]
MGALQLFRQQFEMLLPAPVFGDFFGTARGWRFKWHVGGCYFRPDRLELQSINPYLTLAHQQETEGDEHTVRRHVQHNGNRLPIVVPMMGRFSILSNSRTSACALSVRIHKPAQPVMLLPLA